jgi:hypothetical protein
MQVGGFEPVTIDDTETPHTCAGQVLQHRNTKSTGAHHQHGGGSQARLALWPHFAQGDLARVVRRGGRRGVPRCA